MSGCRLYPASSLNNRESPQGRMIPNPYLDQTERITWRNVLQAAPHLAAQFIVDIVDSLLNFSVGCVHRMCESRCMIAETREDMLALTESEFADYLRSVIRELEQNPTPEVCDRGMHVLADLPPRPRNPEEQDLYRALFVAALSTPKKVPA
jgi:hypothetical protein